MVDPETDEIEDFLKAREEINEIEKGLTLAQLRALPRDELIRRFDLLATGPVKHWYNSAEDYLAEIHRRETDRATTILIAATIAIAILTVAIVALTIVLVTKD